MSSIKQDKQYLCLDPSCFVSLRQLKDTLNVLDDIQKPNLHVIVPSEIYQTIMSEPDEKFTKLPIVLEKWFVSNNNNVGIPQFEKEEYVSKMRMFLSTYHPSPAIGYVGNIEKIGENSIYKNSLVQQFGKITGQILFEIMAVSSEYKARIIAFSETTFSLIQKTTTLVKRGVSEVKKEIKNRARIRTPLLIGMLFMSSVGVGEFIHEFEINGITISSIVIPTAGLIVLANG